MAYQWEAPLRSVTVQPLHELLARHEILEIQRELNAINSARLDSYVEGWGYDWRKVQRRQRIESGIICTIWAAVSVLAAYILILEWPR
jgi:hypothetical protein